MHHHMDMSELSWLVMVGALVAHGIVTHVADYNVTARSLQYHKIIYIYNIYIYNIYQNISKYIYYIIYHTM